MDEKYPELARTVTLGEPICIKLKQIYFAEQKWAACYRQVGAKFTALKQQARKFYPGKKDHEMLMEIIKYTNEDIVELMEATDGVQTQNSGTERVAGTAGAGEMVQVKKYTSDTHT